MTHLAIINGTICDPAKNLQKRGTLLLSGDTIAGVLDSKTKLPANTEIIDAKGCIVAPGFIDLHTHLRDPGYEYREDITTGTAAAAAGGFTTIVCMANTQPVNDNKFVTNFILQKAREKGLVQVLPVGAVSKNLKGEELAAIGGMAAAGVVALSDDGMPVMNGSLMRRAMQTAADYGLFVITHAEDLTLSGGSMHEGSCSCSMGIRGIPSVAEEAMIYRDVELAALTNTHLHVAHVSTAKGLEIIRQAKKKGVHVTCEVTPHHLFLTDEACNDYNTNAKMYPPLRTKDDNNALLKGLLDGTVDAIATDHAPHAPREKNVPFEEANFGVTGLESALPILLHFVHQKRLPLMRMLSLFTHGPAKILKKQLGTLKQGSPANVVIFDPERPSTFAAKQSHSKSSNTPFLGRKCKGAVICTIYNGRIVYKNSL